MWEKGGVKVIEWRGGGETEEREIEGREWGWRGNGVG